jgi:YVTN family beta-propeller protein
MKMHSRRWIHTFLLVPSLLAALSVQAFSQSGYHLIKQVKLGGEGGWDALTFDAKAHRLYISRSTHVMVVDVDSGALVGDVPNTPGVHGIAIVSDLNKGFTSNGRDSTVTVFDLKTFKVLKQIPVGKNPDAIIYDAASKRIFTFNGASNDATAINPESETVAGTIALEGKPEFAETDDSGHVFVNLEDKGAIAELDSRKLTVLNRWPLAPGEEPSGIALDRKHKRLFAACSNKMMVVMNAENGKVITTVPIGSGVDGAGFDAGTEMAFSSNGGDGTLTIIREDSPEKFSVVENVVTQRGARTMTVDSKTHRVFLVTAEFGATPAPTAERPRPRPSIVPGSFTLLIFGR